LTGAINASVADLSLEKEKFSLMNPIVGICEHDDEERLKEE
jgi:hypothetical protein